MDEKAIVATWLFKTDLTNMNAGEGTTNLKELKTYKNGLPYISGQAVRHALRKAIQRENSTAIKCTPEFPCGNIKECWLCDMFGYLLPGEGAKRWSPIKMSPAMGQVRNPITTDLILRLVHDIECPNCKETINPYWARETTAEGATIKEIKKGGNLICPKCKKQFKAPYDIRQAIAYKQLTDNIYRVSIAIDINALGREEIPNIEGEGNSAKINGIKYKEYYDDTERKKRVVAILNAIGNISDFASQSREMSNASPDAILISVQKQYNHRVSSAFRMEENGVIDTESFKGVIKDVLEIPDAKIYVGIIQGIFKDQRFMNVLAEIKDERFKLCDTPAEVIKKVSESFQEGMK
jgi:CRISPR-associated protein Cst2